MDGLHATLITNRRVRDCTFISMLLSPPNVYHRGIPHTRDFCTDSSSIDAKRGLLSAFLRENSRNKTSRSFSLTFVDVSNNVARN